MFKKRGIKIAGITLVSIIVVLFVLSFAVTFFINKKLPQIIAEKMIHLIISLIKMFIFLYLRVHYQFKELKFLQNIPLKIKI